jgi:hypothetical protein
VIKRYMIASGLALRSGAALTGFAQSTQRLKTSIGVLGLALALSHSVALAALPPSYQGKPFEDSVYQEPVPEGEGVCHY